MKTSEATSHDYAIIKFPSIGTDKRTQSLQPSNTLGGGITTDHNISEQLSFIKFWKKNEAAPN